MTKINEIPADLRLNRSKLAEVIRDRVLEQTNFKLPTKIANLMVTLFLDVVKDVLGKGGNVRLDDFGSFIAKEYKATERQNPQNREEIIQVPARYFPSFKAGKSLRSLLRHGAE